MSLWLVLGVGVIFLVAMALRGVPREPEPGTPAPAPPPPLPLSDGTRAQLVALGFKDLGGRFWQKPHPQADSSEAIAYGAPTAARSHELFFDPCDLPSVSFPLRAFQLEAIDAGNDRSGLEDEYLLPAEAVPGLAVQAMVDLDATGLTPLRPEQQLTVQQLFTAEIVALLQAIPQGRLEVVCEDDTSYELWVRWPNLDARSGEHVGTAVQLLQAVDVLVR